jgi:hypothetical protein
MYRLQPASHFSNTSFAARDVQASWLLLTVLGGLLVCGASNNLDGSSGKRRSKHGASVAGHGPAQTLMGLHLPATPSGISF